MAIHDVQDARRRGAELLGKAESDLAATPQMGVWLIIEISTGAELGWINHEGVFTHKDQPTPPN